MRAEAKKKEAEVEGLQAQVLAVEAQKLRDIEGLRSRMDEVKEANAQLISLYENQLQELRQRFVQERKRTELQLDQMFSLAQREAVIKNLKKELTIAKG